MRARKKPRTKRRCSRCHRKGHTARAKRCPFHRDYILVPEAFAKSARQLRPRRSEAKA